LGTGLAVAMQSIPNVSSVPFVFNHFKTSAADNFLQN
jgi:hypothetical protein